MEAPMSFSIESSVNPRVPRRNGGRKVADTRSIRLDAGRLLRGDRGRVLFGPSGSRAAAERSPPMTNCSLPSIPRGDAPHASVALKAATFRHRVAFSGLE